jgi:F-box and leucine-rich repeat protein 2/20
MNVPAASIDAIVQIPAEQVSAAVTLRHPPHPSSTSNHSSTSSQQNNNAPDLPITDDQQQQNKSCGPKRLLRSLRSMASSPSLAKMGKSRLYRSGNRASMSCVSLSTPYQQPVPGSSDSNLSQQFSTAPTSVTSSPGPATPTRIITFPRDGFLSVGLPTNIRSTSPNPSEGMTGENDDYYSCPAEDVDVIGLSERRPFNLWIEMPTELRIHILSYLTPKEITRCSRVSKEWHTMCFDGQLWQRLDTSAYYRDISSDALVKIINRAGPFVRDLNLRGCIQLKDAWTTKGIEQSCKNLENFSLEGCLIDRPSLHSFLNLNSRLVHINLCGLAGASFDTMRLISKNCPKLEHLNVTWCTNVSTSGLRHIISACPLLKDLRAGETRGWDNVDFAVQLFKRNRLERLILTNCDSLTNEFVSALMQGVDSDIDFTTGRAICEPRKLKHLDLSRCRFLTDAAILSMAHYVPYLEGLQLAKLSGITDLALTTLFPTLNVLTHLDLEELESLTNASLVSLAASRTASTLRHLTISYCETLGDAGMLPILHSCPNLESIDMDNTRISDLVLIEAAAIMRTRNRASRVPSNPGTPGVTIGLRMAVYDCASVTWNGVLEVLSRNAELSPANKSAALAETYARGRQPLHPQTPNPFTCPVPCAATHPAPKYEHRYIALKAFYTWQPTIVEHTRRVQEGHFERARRLERKWAEFMMMGEEANHGGGRRRRRRMREALAAMAGESDGTAGRTGRRRARSDGVNGVGGGSCVVM